MEKLILTSIFSFISFCSIFAGQFAGGDYHSLFLKQDGTVWAWGGNDGGQLGDGSISNRLTPVLVSGITDIISISAGDGHSLAVKRDGTAWAWGYNCYGQLGNGRDDDCYSWTENPTPGQVIGLSEVIDVAGGLAHSLLLKSDGTVWACGMNRNGQLGDGTTMDRSTPVQVVGLSEVISIACGGEHSLALKNDGTVWAWGWNDSGQLGDGNGGWEPGGNKYSTVPVQPIGLSNITAIAGGIAHSLAMKNDGTVWAWGFSWYGQIGDGNSQTQTNSLIPVQSLVSGVIAIAGGEVYSLALTSYGVVLFWGKMEWNDITGRGAINSITPIHSISDVKAMAGGGNHALALKNDGTLWAWGYNGIGQLGDGTTENRMSPVHVKGFSTGGSATAPTTVLAADFDEDGKDDPVAISSSGDLFYWNSSQSFNRHGPQALGTSGTPAVGDADGDGRADMALVDNSGNWHFFLSSRGYLAEAQNLQPSVNSPQPLLADFDGDGKADPAIVSATGVWYFWLSADNYSPASGSFLPRAASGAVSGATPMAADFDADGRADPVMVSATGGWYLWPSSQMYTQHGPYDFGVSGKPVAGDFDGDGRADPGMVDSTGNWNLFLSAAFYTRNGPWYLVLP